MQNELYHLGVWLVTLKKEQPIIADNKQLRKMRSEFERITDKLMNLWVAKGEGLEYVIDFHEAEGIRLLRQIRPEDRTPRDGMHLDESGLYRLSAYFVLYNGLCKLLEFLATLQTGPDVVLNLPGIDNPD